jgi:polyhydroxyalkanoate synthesis regulator phasin
MRFLILARILLGIEATNYFLNLSGETTMNNIEMMKEKATVAQQTARKVFLAGLGAYGKGFEETKGRFENLSADSNKVFAELVKKGESLEAEGKNKFVEAKSKVVAKADFNNRVEALRTKLGLNQSEEDLVIQELSAKIDALTEVVAKLAK